MRTDMRKQMIYAAIGIAGTILAVGSMRYFTKENARVEAVASQNTTKDEVETEKIIQINSEETSENRIPAEEELPISYKIENFPIINQMPELPTGCEVTALTMVLNHYGFTVDKETMAVQYLPTLISAETYYGEDGNVYGNDMNEYFIGDPRTEHGVICGTGAIITAANGYLEEGGSSVRAEDITGVSAEELYRLVSKDIPVVVWCTIGMQDRAETQGWYTEEGEYVDWSRNDHGAVLIGYSQDTVTIADPISGEVEYSRLQFESVFASRGNQGVILREII